jgi:hypothetical protein
VTNRNPGLTVALNAFSAAITSVVTRKAGSAAVADNALTFNGKTAATFIADNAAISTAHINNTNNPHGTTASQAGAYTKEEANSLVAQCIPRGILPISRIGAVNGAWPVSLNTAAKRVDFTGEVPVVLAGIFNMMPIGSVGYSTTVPRNYVYVRLNGGIFSYVIESSPQAETTTNMLFGVIDIVSGNVTDWWLRSVTRLDTFRISQTPAGSAIPVSGGTPDSAQPLLWK